MSAIYLFLLVLFSICHQIKSYKILGIFPTMSPSHYIVGSTLMKGLASKGHDITIISPFKLKHRMDNVREICTRNVLAEGVEMVGNILRKPEDDILTYLSFVANTAEIITNLTLSDENVEKLLQSNETFDAAIFEGFATEAFFGIAQRVQAPVVHLTTEAVSHFLLERISSPKALSHVPHATLHSTNQMNFAERLSTFVASVGEKVFFDFWYLPRQQALYEKFFPDPKPSLRSLLKNTSLVLVNSHFTIHYPRPYAQNVIEVGGFHIDPNVTLPDDIQTFLDDAKDGAIYFSLGSNVEIAKLRKDKCEEILKVLGSLKQKVLWKWEEDTSFGKIPENIMIRSWFPQSAILAHPNVKLFISHGGSLSVYEAVYHAVPFIAIPFMSDQPANAARAEKAGYSIALQWEDINKNTLEGAIRKMLTNEKYARRIKEISKIFRDQPTSPLQRAIYWVEYVARHKGAPHLRSGVQNLSFLQYHNLDLYGMLLFLMLVTVNLFLRLVTRSRRLRSNCNKIKIH